MENNFIGFRNLKFDDLPIMHKWLNTKSVMQWYGKKEKSFEEVENEYCERIIGKEPINAFIIEYELESIGYIQTYLIKDFPDYNSIINLDENVSGMDLFIGDMNFIHKGFGSKIIHKFLGQIVFNNDKIISCIIGPEPKNTIAIKAYEKVGFKHLKTIKIPNEDEQQYIMRISKVEYLLTQ